MSKKRILCLSLIIGALIEGAVCGVGMGFGKFGPCGAGNASAGILLLAHLPSFQIVKSLMPEDSSLFVPALIFLSAAMWSMLAFIIISLKNFISN